jgi:hypothetical protein
MRTGTLLLLALALLLPGQALAAKPIEDLVGIEIPARMDGSKRSLDEVKEAIIAGCKFKGWAPVVAAEDRFEASIHVRTHFAKVGITFDQDAYSIRYLDSRELDYDPQKRRIHRNYNKWVILLSEAIQREFVSQQ